MKQLITSAIILNRIEYGEADRILTLLTPDIGKLRVLAKGVRKVKSKLAGGIELFSVSEITFIRGRGEVGTLVSTRLIRHYNKIVQDLERTMLGYEIIKQLHKVTEDAPEREYFDLLEHSFEMLNNPDIPNDLIIFWFNAQLLRLAGHTPNLVTDDRGGALEAGKHYVFDYEHMSFSLETDGRFGAPQIKFLRLVFEGASPQILVKVKGADQLVRIGLPLIAELHRRALVNH